MHLYHIHVLPVMQLSVGHMDLSLMTIFIIEIIIIITCMPADAEYLLGMLKPTSERQLALTS